PHRGHAHGAGRGGGGGAHHVAAPGRGRLPRHDPRGRGSPRHLARHLRREPRGHRRHPRPARGRADVDARRRERGRPRGVAAAARPRLPPLGPSLGVNERAVEPLSAPPDATVVVPGSKSLTNRALLLAALAEGTSALEGVLVADDTEAMIDATGTLGAEVLING